MEAAVAVTVVVVSSSSELVVVVVGCGSNEGDSGWDLRVVLKVAVVVGGRRW